MARSNNRSSSRSQHKGSNQPIPQDPTLSKHSSFQFFRSLKTLPLRDLSVVGFSSNTSSSSSSSSNININSIPSVDSPIKEIAWNALGTRVACTHVDRSISIWPALDPFENKNSRISGSAANAYATYLSSIVSQSPIVILRGAHDRSIEAISWDPVHANRLASCSADRTFKIWDTLPTAGHSYSSHRSSRVRYIQSASSSASCLASVSTDVDNYVVRYSPCGQFLGVGTKSDQVILYHIIKEKKLVDESANEANGGRVKSRNGRGNSEKYTTVITLKRLCSHKESDEIYDICWSNNPRVFALSMGNGNIRLLRFNLHEDDLINETAEDGQAQQPTNAESNEKEPKDVEMLDIAQIQSARSTPVPDTSSARDQKTLSSLQVLHTLRGHRTAISCLAFDPKGKYLAAGSNEGIVSLWDISTSDFICFRTFHKPDHSITSLSISHDGAYIAFGVEGVAGSSHNTATSSAPVNRGSNGGINIENLPLVIAHVESGEYVHGIDYPQFFSPNNISFVPGSNTDHSTADNSDRTNSSGNASSINDDLSTTNESDHLYYGSGLGSTTDFSTAGDSHYYHGGSQLLHPNGQQQLLAKGTRPLVSWHPLKYCIMYSADTMYNPFSGGFGFTATAPGEVPPDRGVGGPSPLMILGRF